MTLLFDKYSNISFIKYRINLTINRRVREIPFRMLKRTAEIKLHPFVFKYIKLNFLNTLSDYSGNQKVNGLVDIMVLLRSRDSLMKTVFYYLLTIYKIHEFVIITEYFIKELSLVSPIPERLHDFSII